MIGRTRRGIRSSSGWSRSLERDMTCEGHHCSRCCSEGFLSAQEPSRALNNDLAVRQSMYSLRETTQRPKSHQGRLVSTAKSPYSDQKRFPDTCSATSPAFCIRASRDIKESFLVLVLMFIVNTLSRTRPITCSPCPFWFAAHITASLPMARNWFTSRPHRVLYALKVFSQSLVCSTVTRSSRVISPSR
jgi:hypothetical protein